MQHGLRLGMHTVASMLGVEPGSSNNADAASFAAAMSPSTTAAADQEGHVAPLNITEQLLHSEHCFDYLRQSLMCAADTTLEEMEVVDGEVLDRTDGWGAVHKCRSFEAVFEWAEKHRATDFGGIA